MTVLVIEKIGGGVWHTFNQIFHPEVIGEAFISMSEVDRRLCCFMFSFTAGYFHG